MVQNIDPASERFLAALRQTNRTLGRVEGQISSGRKLNRASDNPDQISQALQIRADLEHLFQIRANLSRVRETVNTSEQALQSALLSMDRAASLASQGASGTSDATRRRLIAIEVEGLIGHMISLSNTRFDGRYVFGGTRDDRPPYVLDMTRANPAGDYQGTETALEIRDPRGSQFSYAHNAREIFDHPDPSRNVFAALVSLRAALLSDDSARIETALASIRTASEHLNGELHYVGVVQGRLAEAVDFSHKQEFNLKTALSEIEDTDLTAAILELKQARHQQEAALAAKGTAPRTSLFDYLK